MQQDVLLEMYFGGPGSGRHPEGGPTKQSMSYEEAKTYQDTLDKQYRLASQALRAFPKTGPFGLTTDAVKAMPAFKEAKSAYDTAFKKLQTFNTWYVKQFKTEIALERRKR